MRKILTLTLLLTLSFINANNDSLVKKAIETQIPDSSTLTFKEVYSDIKVGLKGLGDALKVGSEHVYEILIKQQIVYSICYMFLPIMFIIFIIAFSLNIKKAKWYTGYRDTEDDWNRNATLTLIFATLSLVMLVASVVNFGEMMTGFINPEYGAIKDIMNFINK